MNRGGWNSLVQGINVGYGLGEKYQQAKEREELDKIMSEQVTDQQAAYDNYNAGIAAQDRATFGEGTPSVEGADRKGLGYSVAGRTFKEKPSDAQVYAAKMDKVSDYHMKKGDVQKALTTKDYGVRVEQQAYEKARREKIDALDKEFEDYYKAASTDEGALNVLRQLMPEYNSDSPGFNDGHILAEASRPGGGVVITRIDKRTGQVVDARELTPKLARQMLDQAYLMRMKAAGGDSRRWAMEQEGKDRTYGLQERGVAVQERAQDNAEQRNSIYDKLVGSQIAANEALASKRNQPLQPRVSEMSVADRIALVDAIDTRTEALIRRAGKDPAKVAKSTTGEYEEWRRQAAAELGFGGAHARVKGLGDGGQPSAAGSGAIAIPPGYAAPGKAEKGTGGDTPAAGAQEQRIPGDPAFVEPSRGLGGGTFVERRDAALEAARRQTALKNSAEYRQLEAQRKAAMRAGNATEVNAIMEKQQKLLAAGQ